MRASKIIGMFGVLLVVCGVAGCIPFEDFGKYWDKGTIDPEVEGSWFSQGTNGIDTSAFCNFTATNGGYIYTGGMISNYQLMNRDLAPAYVRTTTLGGHTFLMMQYDMRSYFEQASNISKSDVEKFKSVFGLKRYQVQEGKLRLFNVKQKALIKAVEGGVVAGKLPERSDSMVGVCLNRLDEKTETFLVDQIDNKEFWNKTEEYRPVPDLKSAIEEAMAYPATMDTPSNSMVTVAIPEMLPFCGEKKDLLMRYLECSPEWRVFKDHDEDIVCYKRNKSGSTWQVGLHGGSYSGHGKTWRNERALFRFSNITGGKIQHEWRKRTNTYAEPDEGKNTVKA